MEAIAVLVVFLMLVFWIFGTKIPKQPKQEQVFKRIGTLLTQQENRFSKVLRLICEGKYHVYSKVRIADILEPSSKKFTSNWWSSFNKINSKHFDFVLTNPDTSEVVLVIELDDDSHNNTKAKQRDRVKNEACYSAKLPILRHRIQSNYDVIELNEKIENSLIKPE